MFVFVSLPAPPPPQPPRKDLHYGMIQRYIVGYKIYEDSPSSSQPWSSQAVSYTGRRQKLVLEDLQTATRYQVMVQAINGEGPGPSSPQLVCSTLQDGERGRWAAVKHLPLES